jgi:hypothetical protein
VWVKGRSSCRVGIAVAAGLLSIHPSINPSIHPRPSPRPTRQTHIFAPIFLRAAHNAARAADESSAMNETSVHVVITDVRRSDLPHASSVVNVPSRAGQARFRAAALSQRCSFVNGATRSLVCGALWLPNLCKKGEGQARGACLLAAHGSHRSRDGGTESSSGRINWGPSVGREPRAIMV